MLRTSRRAFLAGFGAMLAAPAIVHAGNLMPVKALKPEPYKIMLRGSEIVFDQPYSKDMIYLLESRMKAAEEVFTRAFTNEFLYGSADPDCGLARLVA